MLFLNVLVNVKQTNTSLWRVRRNKDTLRNYSCRTRPPESDVGIATAQSEPDAILK